MTTTETQTIEIVTGGGRWLAATEVNRAAWSLAQGLGPCEGASDRGRGEALLAEAVARVTATGEAEEVRLVGGRAHAVGSRAGETETVTATVRPAADLRWIGRAGGPEHDAYDASQPPRCGAVIVTTDADQAAGDPGDAYVPDRRSEALIAALYAEGVTAAAYGCDAAAVEALRGQPVTVIVRRPDRCGESHHHYS